MTSPTVTAAICASRPAVSCALRTGDGEVFASTTPARGSNLAAVFAKLLEQHGSTPEQLSRLLVDVGPGSYTGLRVAITFARFLARFGGASIATATSFELIGEALGLADEERVRIALDARRGRVHVGEVARRGGTITPLREPVAIEIAAFESSLRAGDEVVADESLGEWLENACARAGAALRPVPDYGATDLFSVSPREQAPASIEPLYLMGSYAE